MRFLRLIRAVLWSVFGVRRRSEAARDVEGAHPGALVGAAALVALVLISTIAALVHFLAPHRAKPEAAVASISVDPGKLHGPIVLAGTMEERMRPCTACHGAETQTTKDGFSPRIAGKPAGYLFNQLASFRDGRRTYAPMVYLVQYMSDDYLREIARE